MPLDNKVNENERIRMRHDRRMSRLFIFGGLARSNPFDRQEWIMDGGDTVFASAVPREISPFSGRR